MFTKFLHHDDNDDTKATAITRVFPENSRVTNLLELQYLHLTMSVYHMSLALPNNRIMHPTKLKVFARRQIKFSINVDFCL